MTIPSSKGCFWNVTMSDSEMMTTWSEVYLWEMTSTVKLVKQVINPRDGILFLDCGLVQLSIVNAHSERTIFLLYEQYWCTPLWNTWSNESLIYKVLQLFIQFLKLCSSYSVRRNRNRLGICKEINFKVNFFQEGLWKIFWKYFWKS